MRLRTVKISDRKELAKYLVHYWKSRGMNQFPVSWTLRYLKNGMTFEMKEERFVLLGNGNEILGTIALLMYNENVAEIRDEVWENYRFGSLLLKYLINYARKKRFKKIYSLALKDKIMFYRNHGFVKEGLLRSQFKKGEHVTVMSKFI